MPNQRISYSFPLGVNFGTAEHPSIDGSLVVLVADVVNGGGESRYSGLRVPGAAGVYQVPTGVTLYLTRVQYTSTVAGVLWEIGSGTAAVGGSGTSQTGAPTGVASVDSRTDGVANGLAANPTALVTTEATIFIPVAATLYPFVRSLTASSTLYVAMLGLLQ